jgi:hypothetical protein
MKTKRPDIVKIFAQVTVNAVLKDNRLHKRFSLFGNVLRVARQHGVEMRPFKDGIEFSAPKSRMQRFAEKLHFSHVRYREID